MKSVVTNEFIADLLNKKDKLREQIAALDVVILAYQDVCGHTGTNGEDLLVDVGRDSHKTYFECSNCGKRTSV